MAWEPSHYRFRSSSLKSHKNTCRFYMKNDYAIRSEICTCHASSAVVACANLGPDLDYQDDNKIKENCHEIWIMSSYSPCEMGPWSSGMVLRMACGWLTQLPRVLWLDWAGQHQIETAQKMAHIVCHIQLKMFLNVILGHDDKSSWIPTCNFMMIFQLFWTCDLCEYGEFLKIFLMYDLILVALKHGTNETAE